MGVFIMVSSLRASVPLMTINECRWSFLAKEHFMVKRMFAVLCVSGMMAACNAMHKQHEAAGEESQEQKVAMEQIPAAAQATIREQAGGQKIDSVDAMEQDGKTVYEIDVVQN